MIVTTDIGNILCRDCKAFGIEGIYQKGNIPVVPEDQAYQLKTERIDVYPESLSVGTYWKKGVVSVHLHVPDTLSGTANLDRLAALERQAMQLLDDVANVYDGTSYRYAVESIGTEADTALKCHYVNVKILVEILNVK